MINISPFPPLLSPSQPPLYSASVSLTFLDYTRKFTQYLSFCVCLISLTKVSSRFIHVVTNGSIFFFIFELYIYIYMYMYKSYIYISISKFHFSQKKKRILKIHRESQKTLNGQSNTEKEEQSWRHSTS